MFEQVVPVVEKVTTAETRRFLKLRKVSQNFRLTGLVLLSKQA